MKKIIKDNFLVTYIILNILYLTIGSFSFTHKFISYSKFGRTMVSAFILNFIVVLLLIIIKKIKKEYKIRAYDVFILLIGIFALISTHYAIVKKVALYGTLYRYEGLYAILYYLSLVFLSSFLNKDKKKIVIGLMIFVGIYQAIYAYSQILDVPFVIKYHHYKEIWATGTLNNPNFFGAFMVIVTSYLIGLFIDKDDILYKMVLAVGIIITYSGLLISNTTSCAVGLIGVLFFLIIYSIKNKKYKSLLVVITILLLETFAMDKLNMTTLVDDLIKTKNETVEIAKGNIDGSYGTKRLEVWKRTLKVVPDNLIHGVGIDNFMYAFNRGPLILKTTIYDKAHNDYLQILVTQGIFSVISYLSLFAVVTLTGLKNSFKNKEIYLVLPVIGYLIQNFFNISTIEVAPFFYISLGLLIDREEKSTIYKKFFKRLLDILISVFALIILIPVYIIVGLLIIIIDKMRPIYKQIRTGKNGKNFTILKFQTMKNGKVTKLGKCLRTISIDEIPQLINVIKGDMSLIGPRPWITDYYERFNDEQKRRVSIRPGIIGLAQINGRNNISVIKKIEYDLKYIDNLCFYDDFKIFLRCFKSIITKEDFDQGEENIRRELVMLENKNKMKTKKK